MAPNGTEMAGHLRDGRKFVLDGRLFAISSTGFSRPYCWPFLGIRRSVNFGHFLTTATRDGHVQKKMARNPPKWPAISKQWPFFAKMATFFWQCSSSSIGRSNGNKALPVFGSTHVGCWVKIPALFWGKAYARSQSESGGPMEFTYKIVSHRTRANGYEEEWGLNLHDTFVPVKWMRRFEKESRLSWVPPSDHAPAPGTPSPSPFASPCSISLTSSPTVSRSDMTSSSELSTTAAAGRARRKRARVNYRERNSEADSQEEAAGDSGSEESSSDSESDAEGSDNTRKRPPVDGKTAKRKRAGGAPAKEVEPQFDFQLNGICEEMEPPAYALRSKGVSALPAVSTDSVAKCLELCMPAALFELAVQETNRYGPIYVTAINNRRKTPIKWEDTTVDEMRKFHGLVVAMAVSPYNNMPCYWRRGSSGAVSWPQFGRWMTLHRFRLLKKCLHFANNATNPKPGCPGFDKLHKLRHVQNMLNDAWMPLWTTGWAVSVDEMMVDMFLLYITLCHTCFRTACRWATRAEPTYAST